jgi:hypothetical protein
VTDKITQRHVALGGLISEYEHAAQIMPRKRESSLHSSSAAEQSDR